MNKAILISTLFAMIFFNTNILLAEETYDINQIKALIQKLGDSNYKNREVAKKELEQLPNIYRKVLVAELKLTPNLEIKERLKGILDLSEDNIIELFSGYYLKAQELFKEKKFAEAKKEIDKIFAIDEDYNIAHELNFKILESIGDYKKCIEILSKKQAQYEKGSAEYTRFTPPIIDLLIKQQNYKEAFTLLENLLNLGSNRKPNYAATQLLCHLYEHIGLADKAEELLVNNVKEDYAQTLTDLAWFYIRQNFIEKAKPYLAKAIQKNEGTLNQSLNLIYLKEFAKSEELLRLKSQTILTDLKDKTNVPMSDIDNSDIFLLFYLNYSEFSLGKSLSLDFKKLYLAFSEEAKKIWPTPLLGYYGKVLTLEQVEHEMNDQDPFERRQKKCEGYFYAGLLKLCEGNTKEAVKFFESSKEQNISEYVETTCSAYFINMLK